MEHQVVGRRFAGPGETSHDDVLAGPEAHAPADEFQALAARIERARESPIALTLRERHYLR